MPIQTHDPIEMGTDEWKTYELSKDKVFIQNISGQTVRYRVQDDLTPAPPIDAPCHMLAPGDDIAATDKLSGYLFMRADAGTATVLISDFAIA